MSRRVKGTYSSLRIDLNSIELRNCFELQYQEIINLQAKPLLFQVDSPLTIADWYIITFLFSSAVKTIQTMYYRIEIQYTTQNSILKHIFRMVLLIHIYFWCRHRLLFPFPRALHSQCVYFVACKPIIYLTNIQALIDDAKISTHAQTIRQW